ncbi:MAG TPA: hypothetical protein VNW94_18535 [Streptosporangiaceae bacterium]|nr:hypothetical protein [Streptosporangiaceae bacterium]
MLALAIPVLVLAGVGVSAAARHVFAPRPAYGAPPPTGQPLMAWDDARHQVVMVTGPGGHPRADASTWTWDGSGWIQHPNALQPPVGTRFVGAAAYDPARRAVVDVVTDLGNPAAPADVWTWTGAAWQQLLTDGKPLQVSGAALGYDAAHRQLLLVGTDPHGPGSLTTWILQGSEWKAAAETVDAPPGPLHLAFDQTTKRLLLFPSAFVQPAANPCAQPIALAGAPRVHGDCFRPAQPPCVGCPVHPLAWDGSSWTASGMTARTGTVVADPTGDGLLDIVNGGKARGVWRWDGRQWSRAAGLPVPTTVEGMHVVPDPDAHQLVLFGGTQSNGGWAPEEKASDQTWTFDGQQWTMRSGSALPKLPPPATPPPPSPCTSNPAGLHVERNPSGDLFVAMQIPITGPPGACVSTAASVRLETTTGTLLAVQKNPGDLVSLPAFGPGTAFASATWSNWCGRRTGVVVRLTGAGFDLAQPVTAPPPCRSSQMVSTLTVLRLMPVP